MNRKFLSRFGTHVALSLLLALVVGCGTKTPTPAPSTQNPVPEPVKMEKVKIAIPVKTFSYLPYLVADQKGLFKANGLDAELLVMATDTSIQATISGDIDFNGAGSSGLRAALSGLPVKLVANTASKPFYFLVSKSEIKTTADLKGKIIGVDRLTSSVNVVLRSMIRKAGLDPDKDVQIRGLNSLNNVFTGLKANQIDAGLLTPPQHHLAVKDGFKILMTAEEAQANALQGGVVTSDKKIKENPQQVQKMVKAFVEAIKLIQSNKQVAVEVMVKEMALSAEDAGAVYDQAAKLFSPTGDIPDELLQTEIDVWKLEANKPDAVTPKKEQLIDLTFVKAVK